MRKPLGFLFIGALVAVAVAKIGSSTALADYAKSINGAQSLSTTFIFQQVGGVLERYSVDLKKPNLARIDEPDRLVVADGSQITTFLRAQKTYYKQPETPESLAALFRTDALESWAGFFTPDAYRPTVSRDLGTAQKGQQTYTAVEAQYGPAGQKTVTYYLDQTDKIARREEIVEANGGDKSTYVLRTSAFELNTPQRPGLYAFAAPDGTQEVSYEDVVGAKWFTSLSEAEAAAKKANRKILVDFFATWCGPCKRLQHEVLETSTFKKIASEKLILLRIDVDEQKDVSSEFGITAMPTQMVLDSDGKVLNKIVGYLDPATFYSFLNSSLGG
jgi:thiol-disulfide isomerase/thioredoxin